MSKYIIDIPDNVKKIVYFHVGNANAVWTTTNDLDDLETLNSDYINEHFGDLQDTAYQRGFEDGKAVNDKGCEGCMYQDNTIEHHPCGVCCNAYNNRWKAKDDRIEVGDEVEWDNDFTGDRFIVTRIYQPYGKKEQCDGIGDDGDVYRAVLIESLVKTGRHFDIASILEAMKHD